MGKIGEYRVRDEDGQERIVQSDWEEKVYKLKAASENRAELSYLIIDRRTYWSMRDEAFPGNFSHTDKTGETFLGLRVAVIENCSETTMEVR